MSKKREALREELRMHKNKTRRNTIDTLIDEDEDELNLKLVKIYNKDNHYLIKYNLYF